MVQERRVAMWAEAMLQLDRMCDYFPSDIEGNIRGTKIRL